MKLIYVKNTTLKFLGINLFSLKSNYFEHSIENEEENTDFEWHENLIRKGIGKGRGL